MMGSESPKSCTPNRDSLRTGSEGGSEGDPKVFGRRPKSFTPNRHSLRRGPKVGPKVGSKGSEGGPKVFERNRKSCIPNGDSLREGPKVCPPVSPKGVRESWDSIGEGLGCGYESRACTQPHAVHCVCRFLWRINM